MVIKESSTPVAPGAVVDNRSAQYKVVVVDFEKEFPGKKLNTEEGMKLAYKFSTEALERFEKIKYKCSSGKQCAGQINLVEEDIGKNLAKEILELQSKLKEHTPYQLRQDPEYKRLMGLIEGLGEYHQ